MTVESKAKYHPYKEYISKSKEFYQQTMVKASTNLILTLIVISVFVFFAIKPTLVTITELNTKLKEREMVNRTLAKKIEALNQARIVYNKIAPNLPLVEHALPQKVNFKQFASKINYLAFSNNLFLISTSFEDFNLFNFMPQEVEEIEKSRADVFNFRASVAGSFADIKSFIQNLEKIPLLKSLL